MKIEYLREFTVLAEYLNFTAAAEHLYITQPVLSRHMSALEAHLDAQLFMRSTQSVELTEVGALFLTNIKKILYEYEDLRALLRMKKQGFADRLRIGVPYYALKDYLGHFPELFESKYPEIKLQYIVGDPTEVLNALLHEKADLILLSGKNFPRSEQFEFHALFQEPLGVLIGSRDPLAKRRSCALKDLSDKLFFSINDSAYFSELWMHTQNLCRKAGFEPRGPAAMNQAEAAIIAIRRGDGVMVFGRHMRVHASDEIAYLDLTDENCERTVSICCKKEEHSSTTNKFIRMFSKSRKAV
ncbi:MAG: LysR family transcriptional regulator [Clostridiales Family XIII bacterium]|jgi:DNA-binding transcriptional LysR family regulator|nr:LysR family transcriptional regulator [Clostridiales Family XIII bacterium]